MNQRVGQFVATILPAFLTIASARADTSPGPQPAPAPPPIPAPQDVAYPGTIKVAVDATDLDHRIFKVHETIPVEGSQITLLFPEWMPGGHSPGGAIQNLGGLMAHVGTTPVAWRRDPANVYAFHLDLPKNARTLDLDFQFLSAVAKDEGRIQMTQDMLSLEWIQLVLYPAGYFSRRIEIESSVMLPKGWQYGTALQASGTNGDGSVTFAPVTFNTLADSPMLAGRYFERLDLDPGAKVPVHLDVVADRPDLLTVTPAELAAHRALVRQAYALFGSHHYDHYDFLLSLSDRLGGIGLEHHQSSEDGTIPRYFTDWDKTSSSRDLLSHEYTHSWNGKFRRPADLWTPNFNVPMGDSLLWVYEGQTQYWGFVLAARAGLWTKQQALDAFAATAATYDDHVGRVWRALEDTTEDPIINHRRPRPWLSWQRSEDYYSEGQLNWLDIDTLIRERTHGKSLDDFARAFFGVDDGSYVTRTYNFEDVVTALNDVAPYDWAGLLHERLDGHAKGAPLDGLTRGGYRLIYTDTPTEYWSSTERRRKNTNLTFSLA